MDDMLLGSRNKRGDWKPNRKNEIAPIWQFPWKGSAILGFLKGYLFPWNITWFATAVFMWFVVVPDASTMKTLAPGWIGLIFLCNCAAALILYGSVELRLYVKRAQGNKFKYNGQFPGDKKSDVFWFKSQAIEGALRTFLTAVPIWTAYEVLLLWSYANGFGHWTTLQDHPYLLVLVWALIPLWHETHWYMGHRFLHLPFFYKHVHSIHHNSVNPSPWSSLSMHPVEQMMFFSAALIHLVVPSHPILAMYSLMFSGLGAIVGHIGYEKIETKSDGAAIDTHAYTHYLHHKYFEVNYGDALIPLDKIFGTWHDGTEAGDEALDARMEKKRKRINS
ncbi:sterol desaturase family protein [Aestuariivirga litoralis]|uniref:sterol desaturase family protein n=1 Tax=Aestuariivirga litoralis TaxID=2650924 RepID=UPI0018C4D0C1|nr:sterol desaturase family protein [Aestuariivirga litoralis]MBG1233493.1 sterol desaturase family protein [Aestuariivirga litoralis]